MVRAITVMRDGARRCKEDMVRAITVMRDGVRRTW